MIKVTMPSDRIRVEAEPYFKEQLEELGVKVYKGPDKIWTSFPPDPDVLIDLKEIDELQIDAEVKNLIAKYESRKAGLQSVLDFPITEKLQNIASYDLHQISGACWLIEAKNGILNDSVGSGKTVTAILALDLLKPQKVLIITEPIYTTGWKLHLNLWATVPNLESYIVQGTSVERYLIISTAIDSWMEKKPVYLITSYPTFRAEHRTLNLIAWDIIILDEPHHIKNRKTQIYKVVKGLQAKRIFMTGGSLIHNTPADVWALLSIIHPRRFTSYWQFVRRFCKVEQTLYAEVVGGLREGREQAFIETLKTYTLRREIQRIHHSKIVEFSIEDLPQRWIDGYNEIIDTHLLPDGRPIVNETSMLMALSQYLMDPRSIGFEFDFSSKLEILHQLMKETEEPIVVASRFTKMFPTYLQEFPNSAALFQKTSGEERQQTIDRFQKGDFRVLFIGIRTAGTAITLTKSHLIYFLSLDFNPIMNEQALGRILRRGQAKDVLLVDSIVHGTIDNWMHDLLSRKINVIKYVQEKGLTYERIDSGRV